MLIDTGASIIVIDEETFAQFHPWPTLFRGKKFVAYGSTANIPHLGQFEAIFESASRICVDMS